MTRVIYKYPFTTGALNAPDGAVLLVADQNGSGVPTLWIEHEPHAQTVAYFLRPTGEIFTPNGYEVHVGSCICGPFVWHVYKRVPR